MIFLCIFYFFVEIIHLLIGIKCVSNLSSLFGKTFIDLLICEAKKEWVSITLINSPNACYSLESESGNATWVCHLGASDPIAWPITTSLACILTGCWSHEPELGIISRYFSMGLRDLISGFCQMPTCSNVLAGFSSLKPNIQGYYKGERLIEFTVLEA